MSTVSAELWASLFEDTGVHGSVVSWGLQAKGSEEEETSRTDHDDRMTKNEMRSTETSGKKSEIPNSIDGWRTSKRTQRDERSRSTSALRPSPTGRQLLTSAWATLQNVQTI